MEQYRDFEINCCRISDPFELTTRDGINFVEHVFSILAGDGTPLLENMTHSPQSESLMIYVSRSHDREGADWAHKFGDTMARLLDDTNVMILFPELQDQCALAEVRDDMVNNTPWHPNMARAAYGQLHTDQAKDPLPIHPLKRTKSQSSNWQSSDVFLTPSLVANRPVKPDVAPKTSDNNQKRKPVNNDSSTSSIHQLTTKAAAAQYQHTFLCKRSARSDHRRQRWPGGRGDRGGRGTPTMYRGRSREAGTPTSIPRAVAT